MPSKHNFLNSGRRQNFASYPTNHLNIGSDHNKTVSLKKNNRNISAEFAKKFLQNLPEDLQSPNTPPKGSVAEPRGLHSIANSHNNSYQEADRPQEVPMLTNTGNAEITTAKLVSETETTVPNLNAETQPNCPSHSKTFSATHSHDQDASTELSNFHARNSEKIMITHSETRNSEEIPNNFPCNKDCEMGEIPNETTAQALSSTAKASPEENTGIEKNGSKCSQPHSKGYIENYNNSRISGEFQPSVLPCPGQAGLNATAGGVQSPPDGNARGHFDRNKQDSINNASCIDVNYRTNNAEKLFKQRCYDYNGGGYVPPEVRRLIADNIDKEMLLIEQNEKRVTENKQGPSDEDFPTIAAAIKMARNSNDAQSNHGPKSISASSSTEIHSTERSAWQLPTNKDISYAHRLQGPRPQNVTKTKILKLKIVPPFRKEHFTNPNLMDREIKEAYNAIMAMFQPRNRQKITISRTNIQRNGKFFQILLVTAPAEAEDDIAKAKMSGLRIMGKTVFPTGEEYWQFTNSEFPKKLFIRMNNLSALCDDDTLEELMHLPEGIEMIHQVERETQMTDWGPAFSGRAHVAISVQNKEEQDLMKQWSYQRSFENVAHWNDDPVYMSIPALHTCNLCYSEGKKFKGHDAAWCRIYRPPKNPKENEIGKEKESEPVSQNIASNEPNPQLPDTENNSDINQPPLEDIATPQQTLPTETVPTVPEFQTHTRRMTHAKQLTTKTTNLC